MTSNSQQINKSSLFNTPLQLLITSWLTLVTLGGATILCGCTAPEPELLFDTDKVIATIFGDPLSLYAECDLADPVMNMNSSETTPQTDLCTIQAVIECEQGAEEVCEQDPPKCFRDAGEVTFCSKVCESDSECPEGLCISPPRRPGSSLKKLGIEEVESPAFFSSTASVCSTSERIETSRENVLTRIEETLLKEHQVCDPESEVDLCSANYELDCFVGLRSKDVCSRPAITCQPSPVIEDESLCLQGCRAAEDCAGGDVCVDERCVSADYLQTMRDHLVNKYPASKAIGEECVQPASRQELDPCVVEEQIECELSLEVPIRCSHTTACEEGDDGTFTCVEK